MAIFEDNFKDNRNNWWEGKTEYGEAEIDNSLYIESFKAEGFYLTRVLQIDDKYSFEIEIDSHYSTDGGGEHGIIWSHIRNDNNESEFYYVFLIRVQYRGKSMFCIRNFNKGVFTDIQPWKECSYIIHVPNKLKIYKLDNDIDNSISFMINNHQVIKTTYLPICGEGVGIVVNGIRDVYVNYFKARYTEKR